MYRESLQNNRDIVLLSKRLATIDTSVPIEWSLESVAAQTSDAARLAGLYRELEFHSLLEALSPASSEPEKARVEDYATLETAEAVTAYLDGDSSRRTRGGDVRRASGRRADG